MHKFGPDLAVRAREMDVRLSNGPRVKEERKGGEGK